jgi:preprotein translocase subunit SecG
MNIFIILQTAVAVLLIVVILLQNKNAGTGGMFGGGSGETFRTEKRGLEKKLFQATIVLALLFIGLALANLLRA